MGIHSNGADRREGYLTPTSRQRLELLYDTELKYLIQGVDAGFPIYSDFTRCVADRNGVCVKMGDMPVENGCRSFIGGKTKAKLCIHKYFCWHSVCPSAYRCHCPLRFERPTLKQGKTGNWGPGPPRPILKRQSSSSSTLSSSSSSSSGGIGQDQALPD